MKISHVKVDPMEIIGELRMLSENGIKTDFRVNIMTMSNEIWSRRRGETAHERLADCTGTEI